MAGGVDSAGRAAVLAMADDLPGRLFDEPTRDRLRSLVDIDFSRTVRSFDDPEVVRDLEGIEVIITGWGSPRIDATVLAAAPRLRAVLHAAGSVRGHVAPECWDRGVVVSSAADANALPVAEYTVAMILLAGKGCSRRSSSTASAGAGWTSAPSWVTPATTAGRWASSEPPGSAGG